MVSIGVRRTRLIACAVALPAMPCALCAQSATHTYWAVLRDYGEWCAYANEARFRSIVDKSPPLESAKVTYVSDTLREVTYQAQAESGDWMVIDRYTLTDTGTVLRRGNVFVGQQVEVVQEATIRNGRAGPFRVTKVASLQPKQKPDTVDLDYPGVPVVTDLNAAPYMTLVTSVRRGSMNSACTVRKGASGPP